MRINYLEIPRYKNLENLKFDFKAELVTILVGKNGLGKSNLLEFIAYIFSTIELAEKELDFFTNDKTTINSNTYDFIIEYSCKGYSIFFSALNSKVIIEICDLEDSLKKNISFRDFKKKKQNYLPDYIIGYYSGENSRIKEFFKIHQKKRINNIKSSKINNDFPPLGKFFFTEQNCGELLFFTLSIFRNSTKFKDKIDDLLYNYLGIDKKSKVAIAFNNPEFFRVKSKKSIENLISNLLDSNSVNNFWGISGKIDLLLKTLFDSNLNEPIFYRDEKEVKSKFIDEFIFMEDIQYETLIENLPKSLEDPIHFFDIIQSAQDLGIIYRIYGELIKNGQSINLNYSELSEGEQQLLTILGLILITGRDDCLFLLDEPDTHLNPNWQRDLIQHIKSFNINDDNSHIFLATHSPLVVQASLKEDDVFIFSKNYSNEFIEKKRYVHKLNNLRVDQVLLSNLFGIESARPKYLDAFMKKRLEIIKKGDLTQEEKLKLKEYENEIGYLPTGETLEEIESLRLIHKLAQIKNIE